MGSDKIEDAVDSIFESLHQYIAAVIANVTEYRENGYRTQASEMELYEATCNAKRWIIAAIAKAKGGGE